MCDLKGILLCVLCCLAPLTVLAGDLDPPAGPSDAGSAMYTLEDIYNRLAAGTEGSRRTGAFVGPSAGPGSSGHTLDQVMEKAPAVDDASGALASEVLSGKTYWGLTGGAWGPGTGTMTAREGDNASTGQASQGGVNYFTAPEGYYDGDDRVSATDGQVQALDPDLSPGNIKKDVTIFGVTGNYAGTSCTGTANEADVLYPKTFSNNSSTGLTGQRYGGCTCGEGKTMYGTRWCDNGDGTVTDLTTCLVWLKNASWGGQYPFCTGSYSGTNAQDRASQLMTGVGGLTDGSVEGDWRLPTKTELVGLVNGANWIRCPSGPCNLYGFTGVQSDIYWSSTTYVSDAYNGWWMGMWRGTAGWGLINNNYYVWPVRSGN